MQLLTPVLFSYEIIRVTHWTEPHASHSNKLLRWIVISERDAKNDSIVSRLRWMLTTLQNIKTSSPFARIRLQPGAAFDERGDYVLLEFVGNNRQSVGAGGERRRAKRLGYQIHRLDSLAPTLKLRRHKSV